MNAIKVQCPKLNGVTCVDFSKQAMSALYNTDSKQRGLSPLYMVAWTGFAAVPATADPDNQEWWVDHIN